MNSIGQPFQLQVRPHFKGDQLVGFHRTDKATNPYVRQAVEAVNQQEGLSTSALGQVLTALIVNAEDQSQQIAELKRRSRFA